MSDDIDTSVPSEEKTMITIDGEDAVEVKAVNVALLATRLGASVDIHIGRDGDFQLDFVEDSEEFSEEFDGFSGISTQFVTESGEKIFETPKNSDYFSLSSIPLVPEYDAIEDVPTLPDEMSGSTDETKYDDGVEYNPRGIVRFTTDAASEEEEIESPGLYSYSEEILEWVKIDRAEA